MKKKSLKGSRFPKRRVFRSDEDVRALPRPEPEDGYIDVWDAHVSGFHVRLAPSGRVSFAVRYRVGGKQRNRNIGQLGIISTSKAKQRARAILAAANENRDLIEEEKQKAKQKVEAENAPTIEDVINRYIEGKRGRIKTAGEAERMLRRYLNPIIDKKAASVEKQDFYPLINKVAQRTERQAGILLHHCKAMLRRAEDEGIINSSPIANLTSASFEGDLQGNARSRILSNEEIKCFWENADYAFHKLTALALKLILVTGQRPGEIAGMKWCELDTKSVQTNGKWVDVDVWIIPSDRRGKTQTSHEVPLTKTAKAILEDAKAEVERLSKRYKRTGEFVFETRPGSSVTTYSIGQAVRRHSDKLGADTENEDGVWHPHDLRRTARSGLAGAGVPPHLARLAVGHTPDGIDRVYDRYHYTLEKLQALEAWEAHLLAIIKRQQA